MPNSTRHALTTDRFPYLARVLIIVLGFAVLLLLALLLFTPLQNLYPNAYNIVLAISITLLTAVAVGTVFDLILKDDLYDIIGKKVDSSITAHFNVIDRGIMNVHDGGLANDLFRSIITEGNTLKVMQTFIPDISVNNIPEMQDLCSRGGKIQFLLAHPLSTIVDVRADDLRLTVDEIYFKLRENFHVIERAFLRNERYDVRLKLFRCTPSVCIAANEFRVFMGHFLYDLNSVRSPHLEIRADSSYAKSMLDNFNKIWEISPDINDFYKENPQWKRTQDEENLG